MSLYEKYGQYYDVYYQDKNYASEAEAIHELLISQKSGVQNILEFGCGTGRHAIELAKNGYRVFGIDQSEIMIEHALNNAPDRLSDRVSFQQADARFVQIEERFDAVIALFHVISYQTSDEDVRRVIKNAANHLTDSGLLIFDFWYGPSVLALRPEKRRHQYESDEVGIIRDAYPVLDEENNVVDVDYTIHIHDFRTGKISCFNEKHQMRYFSLPEITDFLATENFSLAKASESFTEIAPSSSTWSVTVCALKQNLLET